MPLFSPAWCTPGAKATDSRKRHLEQSDEALAAEQAAKAARTTEDVLRGLLMGGEDGAYIFQPLADKARDEKQWYKLLWRPRLHGMKLLPGEVMQWVRSPGTVALLMGFHYSDASAALEYHEQLLSTAAEDVIMIPAPGAGALQLFAAYRACSLATCASSSSSSCYTTFTTRATQMWYPDGVYPDEHAGAEVSKFILWDNRQQRDTIKLPQVGLHCGKRA